MRLPTQDLKPNEERKRRRRTVVNIGGSLTNGEIREENLDETTMMRQDKVAKFAHHKRVADYLLGRSVGEGSFAKVRLGLHVQTAEEVAIKVISKARARKDAYVHKNLRREGRILQMARHKSIIQVYDILETDNNYYLVTEFCRGGELIDIVTDKGCLAENDVRRYIHQLVSAVSHLHDHGIVHRDLKVENLLLDEHGDLKVIDFGLSNVIPGTCADPTKALATQCGSPAYAAPELLGKNSYGPKVDVWSIGVITYALLVGKLPFTVEPFRIPKLCRKMLMGDMNPIPSHLSGNCRHFIRRLLIPDPDIRPSIDQVTKMTWITFLEKMGKTSSYNKSHGKEIYSSTDIDSEIVREMTSKLDFEFSNVLSCVRKNRPGEALATYYLLMKQRERHKKTIERHHDDVIGSDGNLDHEIESDKSSEEGANDVDDITQNILPKTLDIFKEIPKKSNTSTENDVVVETHDNKAVANELVETYTAEDVRIDTEESLMHHEKNSPVTPAPVLRIQEEVLRKSSTRKFNQEKSKSQIDRTLHQTVDSQDDSEVFVKTEESDFSKEKGAKMEVECVNSEKAPTLPELGSNSGDKKAKSERKSRGATSMRDILKSVSKAKDALQRRSIFGQVKSGRNDDKKNTGSPELSKFRKLTSKTSYDSGVSLEAKNRSSSKGDDKNRPSFVSNGTHPARIKLPEASPPTTPIEMKRRISTPGYGSPQPSRGSYLSQSKSSRAASLFYGRKQSQGSKTPSLRNRTSYDECTTPDLNNQRLPRISPDKSDAVTSNPLGYDNTRPRYQFPSPPRTPSSRETVTPIGNNSGVREIIEKFHALMGNTSDQTKRASNRSSTTSKSKDSHPTTPSYISTQRTKRDEAAQKKSAAKIPSTNGGQVLRLSTNGGYTGYQRQTSATKNHYVIKNKNDATFVAHFGSGNRDLRTFEKSDSSPSTARRRTPSRGIWYKSAV